MPRPAKPRALALSPLSMSTPTRPAWTPSFRIVPHPAGITLMPAGMAAVHFLQWTLRLR